MQLDASLTQLQRTVQSVLKLIVRKELALKAEQDDTQSQNQQRTISFDLSDDECIFTLYERLAYIIESWLQKGISLKSLVSSMMPVAYSNWDDAWHQLALPTAPSTVTASQDASRLESTQDSEQWTLVVSALRPMKDDTELEHAKSVSLVSYLLSKRLLVGFIDSLIDNKQQLKKKYLLQKSMVFDEENISFLRMMLLPLDESRLSFEICDGKRRDPATPHADEDLNLEAAKPIVNLRSSPKSTSSSPCVESDATTSSCAQASPDEDSTSKQRKLQKRRRKSRKVSAVEIEDMPPSQKSAQMPVDQSPFPDDERSIDETLSRGESAMSLFDMISENTDAELLNVLSQIELPMKSAGRPRLDIVTENLRSADVDSDCQTPDIPIVPLSPIVFTPNSQGLPFVEMRPSDLRVELFRAEMRKPLPTPPSAIQEEMLVPEPVSEKADDENCLPLQPSSGSPGVANPGECTAAGVCDEHTQQDEQCCLSAPPVMIDQSVQTEECIDQIESTDTMHDCSACTVEQIDQSSSDCAQMRPTVCLQQLDPSAIGDSVLPSSELLSAVTQLTKCNLSSGISYLEAELAKTRLQNLNKRLFFKRAVAQQDQVVPEFDPIASLFVRIRCCEKRVIDAEKARSDRRQRQQIAAEIAENDGERCDTLPPAEISIISQSVDEDINQDSSRTLSDFIFGSTASGNSLAVLETLADDSSPIAEQQSVESLPAKLDDEESQSQSRSRSSSVASSIPPTRSFSTLYSEGYVPDLDTAHMKLITSVPVERTRRRQDQAKAQNYKCATCGEDLSGGIFNRQKRCHYSGRVICSKCVAPQSMPIPADILTSLDCREKTVSKQSYEYLQEIFDQPLIIVSAINPSLFEDQRLQAARLVRKRLILAYDIIQKCPNLEIVQYEIGLSEPQNMYLVTDTESFSLKDLVEILSVPTSEKSPFFQRATGLFKRMVEHVTTQCKSCRSKRCFCPMCNDKQPLYPFELGKSRKCPMCGLLFHKECFQKRGRIACPVCTED